MQAHRAAHALGLALLLALSTVAAPASAQDAVQDPKQPSVDNPHMHIWGSSDLNQCWTHFDGNDSSGSASDGYGEEIFGQGEQVEVDFSCSMQENLKQDLYLDANGTITFEFVVAIFSGDSCDDSQECVPLTFTLMKGSTEIAKQEFPSVNKNGNDEALQWNLNTNETMARWNKSLEEPEIHVQFSWPGYNGLDCILFFVDCDGEFRFYYSNNENNGNDTVVNFPVINQTIPGEGGGGDGGIGDTVSDALPGFGLVMGIGALALAAVGASRFTREE
jgi:hypothetical protein